jgi:hypothetical protein
METAPINENCGQVVAEPLHALLVGDGPKPGWFSKPLLSKSVNTRHALCNRRFKFFQSDNVLNAISGTDLVGRRESMYNSVSEFVFDFIYGYRLHWRWNYVNSPR